MSMKQYILLNISLPEFQERTLEGYVFGNFIEGVYDNEKALEERVKDLVSRGCGWTRDKFFSVPITTEKGRRLR